MITSLCGRKGAREKGPPAIRTIVLDAFVKEQAEKTERLENQLQVLLDESKKLLEQHKQLEEEHEQLLKRYRTLWDIAKEVHAHKEEGKRSEHDGGRTFAEWMGHGQEVEHKLKEFIENDE